MLDKNCFDTEDERQKLFDLVDRLPLCRKTLYDTAQAKIESGAARTEREASRQLAEETGRPESAIRAAIHREKEQMHNLVALQPPCEKEIQSTCPLPHVAQNTGDNEWYTPPEFIEAARAVMGKIDLDPASSDVANQTIQAEAYYTSEDNGLEQSWHGKIWLNPPYAGDLIGKFCEKLYQHFKLGDVTEAIVLVNNATETGWFNQLISLASAVVFPKTRVKFLKPEGNPGAPLQGQAVIYLGDHVNKFIEQFKLFGWGAIIYR